MTNENIEGVVNYENSGVSRRGFLRKMIGWSARTAIVATPLYGAIRVSRNITQGEKDKGIVITQQEDVPAEAIEEKTADIENLKLRLIGVRHTQDFTKKHFDALEQLVKNSSYVVAESGYPRNPVDGDVVPSPEETKNTYFKTIYELAKKYHKPIITLDSINSGLMVADMLTGLVGLSRTMKNSRILTADNTTRRELLAGSIKTMGWLGLTIGTWSPGSIFRTGIHGIVKPKSKEYDLENEVFSYNHIIDQRNVQLTKRLLQLPGLLDEDEVAKGEHVMVTFGATHTAGAHYYLTHPTALRLKDASYAWNYNLLDHEGIVQYTPEEDGEGWRVKKLA